MIKNKAFIYGLAFMAVLWQGCWHEDLSGCDKNVVEISLGVESLKGQNDLTDFAEEVDKARFFIFDDSDGTLKDDGMVDVSSAEGAVCNLRLGEMELGKYTLVVVANDDKWCEGSELPLCADSISVNTGMPVDKSSFVRRYSFAHECECGYSDYVELYRTDALVKLRLLNIPESLKSGTITVNQVAEVCSADTVFSGSANADLHFSTSEAENANIEKWFTVFPSVDEQGSYIWLHLNLDNDGAVENVSERIGRVFLKRNSVNEIVVDFNFGNPSDPEISVDVDREWDSTDNVIFDV